MPKQERAERTRETIIRAAASIFEEEGFTAAPLSDITRRATVTKGALYFHFSSKRELAHAVVEEATDTLHALLDGAYRRRHGRDLPLQVLIDLSHAVAGRLADDPVFRAGLRLGTDADLFPGRDGGLTVDWSGVVDELLPKAGGEPADDSAPADRPRPAPLASVLTGLELLFRRTPDRIERETLTSVWRLLLTGLTRTGDPAEYQPGGSAARGYAPGSGLDQAIETGRGTDATGDAAAPAS